MTQASVESRTEARAAPDSPAAAFSAVVENAGALARAELRLAASEAKAWLARVGLVLLLLWVSVTSAQVLILLLAISPLVLAEHGAPSVALMLGLAALPAVIATVLTARQWRHLKDIIHANTERRKPE